jgi:hypothetical protein
MNQFEKYIIRRGWVKCLGCNDMINNEDISDLYIFGYCPHCISKIPKHIPEEQWGKYLNKRKKIYEK